jgi:DNA-binding transcriptional LysR family regulator
MDFDLRFLAHARALAEEGSFARAARALHITQPALSRSIQQLERRTGIAIFERGKGRVVPTELGRLFLERSRELLDRAEAFDRELTLLRGTGTGRLNVGAGTFPTALFMGEAVGRFLRANPGVSIRVANDNWASLVMSLLRRELDLAVIGLVPRDEAAGLDLTPLSEWQAAFIVRKGHPLLGNGALALADVAAYPIASTVRLGPAITERLLAARARRDAARPIPDVGCESMAMLKAAVVATDHVLFATLSIFAPELERGELAALPLADPRLAANFAIARVSGRSLPRIADDLARAIVEADRGAHAAESALRKRWLGGARPARHAAPTKVA